MSTKSHPRLSNTQVNKNVKSKSGICESITFSGLQLLLHERNVDAMLFLDCKLCGPHQHVQIGNRLV